VESGQKPLQLLCDARSTPPRVAAVLVVDGRIEYADFEPSKEVMSQFTRRGDNQIASLELLSIAFGFSTFARELRGDACIWKHAEPASTCARVVCRQKRGGTLRQHHGRARPTKRPRQVTSRVRNFRASV